MAEAAYVCVCVCVCVLMCVSVCSILSLIKMKTLKITTNISSSRPQEAVFHVAFVVSDLEPKKTIFHYFELTHKGAKVEKKIATENNIKDCLNGMLGF